MANDKNFKVKQGIDAGGTVTATGGAFSSSVEANNFNVVGGAFIARNPGLTNGSLWLATNASGTTSADRVTIAGGTSAYSYHDANGIDIRQGGLASSGTLVLDINRNLTNIGNITSSGRVKTTDGLFQADEGNQHLRQYEIGSGAGTQSFLLGKIKSSNSTDGGVTGTVKAAYDYGDQVTNVNIHFTFAQRSGTQRGHWWYENTDDDASTDVISVQLIDDGLNNYYVWLYVGDYASCFVETIWRQVSAADITDSGSLTADTITAGTTLFDTANDPTSEHHIGKLYAHDTITVPSVVITTGGNSSNWNTAYTYSQVGHLPLTGGTLSGGLGIYTTSPELLLRNTNTALTAGQDISTIQFRSSNPTAWTDTGSIRSVAVADWSTSVAADMVFSIHTGTGIEEKLRLTSDGVSITGTISATDYNDTNWNTAYGWGDHSTAGYLTSQYTLPVATDTTLGGIELFSDTDQTVVANAVTTTTGRTYGVQLNADNQAVVNVPWSDTDTNTTYSAGTGLTLTGTTFSVNSTSYTNWNTAYTYSQVGHLPLAGGTLTGALTLAKTGTATLTEQTYNSQPLYFQASGWDTNGSVARTLSWVIQNEPTASVYPDFDLTFSEDTGTIFKLHGRGTTGWVDPRAGTFFGNLHVEAGIGTDGAGTGSLTVAGTITGVAAEFSSFVEANTFNVVGGASVRRNPGNANGSLWLRANASGTAAINKVTLAGGNSAYSTHDANGIDINQGGLSLGGTLVLDTNRNLTNIGTISSGNTSITSVANPTITLKNTDTSIVLLQTIASIEFRGDDDNTNILTGSIRSVASAEWGTGNYGGDMSFSIKNAGSGGTFSEKLRLTNTGAKIEGYLSLKSSGAYLSTGPGVDQNISVGAGSTGSVFFYSGASTLGYINTTGLFASSFGDKDDTAYYLDPSNDTTSLVIKGDALSSNNTQDDETLFAITDADTTNSVRRKFKNDSAAFTKVDDPDAPASGVFEVAGSYNTTWGDYIPMDDESEITFECWAKHISGTDTTANFYAGSDFYDGGKVAYGNTQRYWGANGDPQDSDHPTWRHIKGVMKGSAIRGVLVDASYMRFLTLFNYNGAVNTTRFCGFKFYRSKKTVSSLWLRTHNGAVANDSGFQTTEAATSINIIDNQGNIGAGRDANPLYSLYADGSIGQASGSIYGFGDVVAGLGQLKCSQGLQVQSTTVIDSTRNILNVNTITANNNISAQNLLNPKLALRTTDTTITLGQVISTIEFIGAIGVGSTTAGHIQQVATEDWAAGAVGSDMVFSINTGSSFDERLRLTSDGVSATGDFIASGNVTAYSDIKLKEDIKPIENAISKVQKLRGVTYTRNDLKDTELRHAGLIAQEVELVLPEAVSETFEDIKVVNYNATIALLVEAVKELKAEIEHLKEGRP